jgi:hypothetical protein
VWGFARDGRLGYDPNDPKLKKHVINHTKTPLKDIL